MPGGVSSRKIATKRQSIGSLDLSTQVTFAPKESKARQTPMHNFDIFGATGRHCLLCKDAVTLNKSNLCLFDKLYHSLTTTTGRPRVPFPCVLRRRRRFVGRREGRGGEREEER